MDGAVAVYPEVFSKTGILHHGGRVAANQHRFTGVEGVMIIQDKAVRRFDWRLIHQK
jgi:hypothetical protein